MVVVFNIITILFIFLSFLKQSLRLEKDVIRSVLSGNVKSKQMQFFRSAQMRNKNLSHNFKSYAKNVQTNDVCIF